MGLTSVIVFVFVVILWPMKKQTNWHRSFLYNLTCFTSIFILMYRTSLSLSLSFTYLLNSPLFNTHFKIFFLTFVFFFFFVVLFSKNLCFCSYSFLCVCLLASLCFIVIHLAICTYLPGSFNMCGLQVDIVFCNSHVHSHPV